MDNVSIALNINLALIPIKKEDRSGFLFGMVIASMLEANWTKEQIKAELLKGLNIAIPDNSTR